MAELMRQTDQLLIGRVEEIEGRVPTNHEIKQHAFCGLYPDGRKEYKWKGVAILTVMPPRFDDKTHSHFIDFHA